MAAARSRPENSVAHVAPCGWFYMLFHGFTASSGLLVWYVIPLLDRRLFKNGWREWFLYVSSILNVPAGILLVNVIRWQRYS